MGYTIDKMYDADWDAVRAIYLEGIATREIGFQERKGSMDGVWRDVLLMERRSQVVGG
jgi:L-amino acid N-acyltransferase YncA